MSLLSAEDLRVSFGSGRSLVPVLNGINAEFPSGSVSLLMGPSGSGKTTLLTVLGGLLRPTAGRVSALGRNIYGLSSGDLASFRLRSLGFVFQQGQLLRALSVIENVMLPALLSGVPRAAAAASAHALLDEVGISGLANEKPARLSGGEAQRAALCRALINKPSILLADEPTAALDSASGQRVAELMRQSAKRHAATVVIVTHDVRLAAIADRVVPILDGVLPNEQGEQS